MSIFQVVLKIYEKRKTQRPKKLPKQWKAWMGYEKFKDPGFYCSRLSFRTSPIICSMRRLDVQHPTHSTCIECPLGNKISDRACVGHHGQFRFCKVCPQKAGCKTLTDLIKNPMQVSSPLGVFPAKEITVPKKSAAPITKKNAKPADDDEDEDEIEETEEEETEEEEEDEEEEESDDEESEDEEEEDEDEEEEAPKKKKGKGAKKGNLVPREPIKVPKEILKQASSDVKALLKQREAAQEKGDKVELRKIRAKLRALGFRLSTVNSDAPQISKPAAAKKGKKAKDDEDDE